MAVFVAASDETNGPDTSGDFYLGGFFMSEADWTNHFVPAWEDRVLFGQPPIPYFHTTDMRSEAWRRQHNLTDSQAEQRVTEAARVCKSTGALLPVIARIHLPSFLRTLRSRFRGKREQYGLLFEEPDYMAFMFYALSVLHMAQYWAGDVVVEKVDFVVERKGAVTKNIARIHKDLTQHMTGIGRSDLVPLMGEFISAGKDRVPLQAADLLLWHFQRGETQQMSRSDWANHRRLIDRPRVTPRWTEAEIVDLAVSIMIGPVGDEVL